MIDYRIRDLIVDKINGEWGGEPKPESSLNTKVLRTTNFSNDGRIDFSNVVERFIHSEIVEEKRLFPGDIIVEKSGGSPTQPVGRVVYFDGFHSKVVCNNFTSILRPNNKLIFPKFLFYCLFNCHLTKKTLKYQNKTTGIINLKLENYLEEKIVIPESIEIQKQIVAVLDKAQSIIDKKKSGLQLLNQLLKDIFLDMFGDALHESKTSVSLSSLVVPNPSKAEIKKANLKPDDLVSFIPMAAVGEDGTIDYLETRVYNAVSTGFTYFKDGDVLFAKITPSMENGKGGIAMGMKNGIGFGSTEFHVLRPSEFVNAEWLFHLLALPNIRKFAEANMTGSAGQKRVPNDFFDKLKINRPTKKSLAEFKHVKEEIDKIRMKHKEFINQSEILFKSLLQKAFSEEGLSIQEEAATSQITAAIMEKLKLEVEVLPKNKTVQNFVGRIDKYLQNLPSLASNIKPSASKEISAAVQKLVPSANDMLNFLVEKGVQGFASIQNRLQAEEITAHPFFKENSETKQIAKLLLDKVDDEQKKKEQEVAEAKINDPILQYIGDTKIGNVTFENYHINVVELVKEYFPKNRFSIGNLIEKLAEEKAITMQYNTLEKGIFEAIDNFILTELWEMPFNFPQLEDGLRNLQFLPVFTDLNNYIMSRLEGEPHFFSKCILTKHYCRKIKMLMIT